MSELEGFVGQEQGGTAQGRHWDLPWRPEGGSRCESVSCTCKSILGVGESL